MAQQHNRVALAITAYFGSASASLAWILHRALPPQRERGWEEFLHDIAGLWDNVVPSELASFVFLNFFISALAMVAVLTAALFLGRLSVTESQRLSHRLAKYALFKMMFVGSIIKNDAIKPRDLAVWLAWFAVVGYLRVFLGAAKDRLESLLAAPGARLGRHARGVCLLLLVLLHNAVSLILALRLLPHEPLVRVMLCAFDSAVIAIEGLKTLLRYAVHMADRYRSLRPAPSAAAENDGDVPAAAAAPGGGWDVGGGGWSGKGNFLYHAELVADVLVHAVTLAHYLHVWVLHGKTFNLVDAVLFLDMRAVLLSLLRRLRSHLSYRAATQRLNTSFRDVQPAALAATGCSADCTICMDEIVHVAKQLPCGHVFHLSCLRAWLQQSGSESFTCPNCRKPILVASPGDGDGGAQAGHMDGRHRRHGPDLWLARAVDRAYVRLVVAVEPVLLTVLLRTTLWLGGRAQIRRRAARSPPSPLREGFGESPGPLPAFGNSSACDYDSEDEQEAHDDDDVYGSDEEYGDDVHDGDGWDADSDADADEGRGGSGGDDGRNGDGGRAGARDALGGGGWRRTQRACGGAGTEAHGCGSNGRQHRCGGSSRLQRVAREAGGGPAGAQAGRETRGGRLAGRRASVGAGPSSAAGSAAAARRRNLLLGPPASEELPSYSGDVLARQAETAARQLGRTLSASLRSSWGAAGICAGAVAGGVAGHDDDEVSSRRRRTSRAARVSRTARGVSPRAGSDDGAEVGATAGDFGGTLIGPRSRNGREDDEGRGPVVEGTRARSGARGARRRRRVAGWQQQRAGGEVGEDSEGGAGLS